MNKLYHLARLLLLLLAGLYAPAALAQNATRTVSGKVTTADTKESLPGVTVLLKGTTTGTGAGADGSYSLQVPNEGGTLVFSFVGYVTKEVAIGSQSTVDVALATDQKSLDEVVVVGYGTQKASNVTGAVAGVTAKEIEERPVNRIENALAGQMPGVSVQSVSGEPGADLQIRVRGTGSINASTEPLYVVDGVPVDNLRGINPADVASLEVLKDASAAAIYGSRGSNGVVLITTKRGKAGAAQLQVTGYAGVQTLERRIGVQSAEDWIQMRKEGIDEDWVKQNAINRADDPMSVRKQRLGGSAISSANYYRYLYDPKWAYGTDSLAYTDWQKAFFKPAPMQQYTLGVSGGTADFNYNINGSYLDQQGLVINTGLRRGTIRANFDAKVRKGIRLTMTLAPSLESSNLGRVDGKDQQALNAIQMPPVGPLAAGDLVGANPYPAYPWSGRYISPVAVMERTQNENTRFRLNANIGLNIDLLKGLQLQNLAGVDNVYYVNNSFTPTSASRDWATAANDGALSSASRTQNFSSHYLGQSVLNYTKQFGSHSLNVIGGTALETTRQDNSVQSASKLPNDWSGLFNSDNSTTKTYTSVPYRTVLVSFFGRAQYSYKDKYLVSASLREDGSSKFGANSHWGLFPAASLGWRVSEEPFLKNLTTAISDLKLRASYGVTGNNRIPDNVQYALLNPANYSTNGVAVNGWAPGNFTNPDLRWEQTTSFDAGLDLGLLDNRVVLTGDVYTRTTNDLLLNAVQSASTGFNNSYQNVGSVRNRGVELGLNTRNIVRPDFTWGTAFNVSYNQNVVLKLGDGDTPIQTGFTNLTSIIQVGQPINSFLLYDAIGVYKNADAVAASPHMAKSQAGDSQYRDVNGDGIIDNNDRTIVGNPQPSFVYGLTNTFTYKGFDLSILVNAQQGGYVYSLIGRSIDRPGMGYLYNHLDVWNNRWRSETSPGDGMTPSINATTGAYYDTRWLYSSDYIRIKNVTLGYNLPKIHFYNRARVYVALENAYLFTHYKGGFTPEASNGTGLGSYDYGGYPPARVYTFGFNLTL
jgi:TonB-linked SusC/RagA family outer membrane protein